MHPDDLMKLTCCLKFWFGPGMYIAVLVSDSLACADTDVHTNLNLGSPAVYFRLVHTRKLAIEWLQPRPMFSSNR